MRIHITGWALKSYLNLLHQGTFSKEHYRAVLRPDALRLLSWPDEPGFREPRFWGPAMDRGKKPIPNGFKMKWHNFGNSNVQLRLCVAIIDTDAYLCHAYVKNSPQQDLRESAKLEDRIGLILAGRHQSLGELK